MNVRQATVADVPAIQRLYRELDQHHAGLLPEVFRPLTEDARPDSLVRDGIGNADAAYLVAEEAGQVVGFLNIRKASHPRYPMFRPRDFAMIENAVVDKAYRGRGVGTQLFQAAIAWAREMGLRYVQTTVWDANAGARDFYIAQGFRPMTVKLELDTERGAQQAGEP